MTLYPTAVQGEAATANIVRAIELAQAHGKADVLIIGRGGGSLEDLWCFNEEAVARAIANCTIPTVSAVGHEVDVTIADFVADLRAPTPSAAAEKISPDQSVWTRQLAQQQLRLNAAMRRSLRATGTRLEDLAARLKDPRRELQEKAQRLDDMEQRLAGALNRRLQRDETRVSHLQQRLAMQSPARTLAQADSNVTGLGERLNKTMNLSLRQKREQLEHSAQTLNVVSPLATLGRGYAIVHRQDGSIARRASDLAPGSITPGSKRGTSGCDAGHQAASSYGLALLSQSSG